MSAPKKKFLENTMIGRADTPPHLSVPGAIPGLPRDEDADEHESEEWLVSYADMMTLLFGLFVMLYSLAMEHKGDIDSAVKQISTQAPVVGSPVPMSTKTSAGTESSSAVTSDSALQTAQLQLATLLSERETQIVNLSEIIEKNQSNQEDLEIKLKDALAAASAATAAASAQKQMTTIEQTSQLNEIQKRFAAELSTVQSTAKSKILKESKSLKESIDALSRDKDGLTTRLDQQAKALNDVELENRQLKTQLANEIGSFMMIVLKWSTDKHDLDLKVRDPKGHSFDFGHRTRKNVGGNLLVDSRTGPGVELWQTPKLEPGVYNVDVAFYNDYGNATPAEFEISIVTKEGVFKATKARLNLGKGPRGLKITAASDGTVQIN